ncbi:MAG: cupin domain-containing protein, partial [Clostridia bacterium]|nr:cupin domain-containing protein [Clostridia bacterium]
MYIEKIDFPNGIPISYEAWQIGSYHLHTHKDVIEILLVIKGKAKVTISFETFEMNEGDYVVIRESDSHTFSATYSGCEIVSLYFRMEDYLNKIPYLYYVIFGCESFDLAKYRNETSKIRKMIISIILNLIKADEKSMKEAEKGAKDLLWLLVNDYDMIKYYNRKWDVPFSKIEKYYKIMSYIFDYYYIKNIQEYISQKEYYSKSYITHFFKEVGASSFKDLLAYVRLFKSEEML